MRGVVEELEQRELGGKSFWPTPFRWELVAERQMLGHSDDGAAMRVVLVVRQTMETNGRQGKAPCPFH